MLWLERICGVWSPLAVAKALVTLDADSMERGAAELADKPWDEQRYWITNICDRVVDLVAGAGQLRDLEQLPEPESCWPSFAETDPYGLLIPALTAGGTALSLALRAAFRGGAGVGQLIDATGSLEHLPTNDMVQEALSSDSEGDWLDLFRSYAFVPTLWATRAACVMLAAARDEVGDFRKPGSTTSYLEQWTARLAPSNDGAHGHATSLKAFCLAHLGGEMAALVATSKASSRHNFSDLVQLARGIGASSSADAHSSAIALRFQRRVAELFSSLGMRTVAAGVGEPLPDTYVELITGDYLLVDAKSTKSTSGYGLGQSDRDAIARYVEEAPDRLPNKTRVRAVLIVGPAPAAGLTEKLQKLEERTTVPVRFASAAQLVDLREAHQAGSPLKALSHVITGGEYVLSEGWWRPAVDQARQDDERLADYIKKSVAWPPAAR